MFELPKTKIEFFSLLIIVFVILFIVILVFVFLSLFIKKIIIKKGDKSIILDSKGNPVDENNKVEIDKNEKLYSNYDMFTVIFGITTIHRKMLSLELKLPSEILEKQKRFVKKQINLIRELDLKIYLKLLTKKQSTLGIDLLENSNDYKSYINISYRVYKLLNEKFDEILFLNHLDEKSKIIEDWNSFVSREIKNLKADMNTELSINYLSEQIILKSELEEEFEKYFVRDLENSLELMFEESKDIMNKEKANMQEEMSELSKSFEELAKEYCGSGINLDLLQS